jgi:hypothetical protein
MSALRVNAPGQPVRYIDLGPARGRLNVSGFIAMGGPLTADASRQTKNAQHQRKFTRSLSLEPCGQSMPKGGTCTERRGHKSHCRATRG